MQVTAMQGTNAASGWTEEWTTDLCDSWTFDGTCKWNVGGAAPVNPKPKTLWP